MLAQLMLCRASRITRTVENATVTLVMPKIGKPGRVTKLMMQFRLTLGGWASWLTRPLIVLLSRFFRVTVYVASFSCAVACMTMTVMTIVTVANIYAKLALTLKVVLAPLVQAN